MLSDPESTAGKGRATIDEQRNFLIELSLSFYTICSDAIEDRYFHDFFQNDKDSEKFLWANLMNLHVEFPNKFYQNGAPWDEKTTDYIGVGCCDSYKTKNQAITEAYEDVKRTRGRELPSLPNPKSVERLFQDYSYPWGDIARNHITEVGNAVNRFFVLVIQFLVDEGALRDNILKYWIGPTMKGNLEAATTKLDELLDTRCNPPFTVNPNYSEKVMKLQQKRANKKSSEDMDWVAAENVVDITMAYYEIALYRFIDNVVTLAIQPLIVRDVGITSSLDVGVIGARPEIGTRSPASLPASLFPASLPASYTRLFTNLL